MFALQFVVNLFFAIDFFGDLFKVVVKSLLSGSLLRVVRFGSRWYWIICSFMVSFLQLVQISSFLELHFSFTFIVIFFGKWFNQLQHQQSSLVSFLQLVQISSFLELHFSFTFIVIFFGKRFSESDFGLRWSKL